MTFDPSARSEADRAKLRREVDHLTAELTEHQTVVRSQDTSALEGNSESCRPAGLRVTLSSVRCFYSMDDFTFSSARNCL